MKTNSQNPSLLLEYAHNALGPLKPSYRSMDGDKAWKGEDGKDAQVWKMSKVALLQ